MVVGDHIGADINNNNAKLNIVPFTYVYAFIPSPFHSLRVINYQPKTKMQVLAITEKPFTPTSFMCLIT